MCHHSPCRRTQLRPESTVAEKPEPGPRDESLLIVKSGYKLNSILLDFYSQEYIHKVLFSNTIKVLLQRCLETSEKSVAHWAVFLSVIELLEGTKETSMRGD